MQYQISCYIGPRYNGTNFFFVSDAYHHHGQQMTGIENGGKEVTLSLLEDPDTVKQSNVDIP